MDTAWKHCLIDYLKSLRSPMTRESYSTILLRFFSQHEPEKVTKRAIEHFMRTHFPDPHRKGEQGELAVATMNQRVAAIASLYRFASSYVPEHETEPLWNRANPATGIVRGRAERSPRGLVLEELERLFSVISPVSEIGIRDKALLLLYFWTARRRSELALLCYGDITETHFPDEHGGVRKSYTVSFRGKGHQSEIDHQEIPASAMEAIRWYLLASGRDQDIKPSDPLFTTMTGNRPVAGSTIAKRIAHYSKVSGIHASLHVLRHSSSRARYESGEDIRSIQHLLRHSSLQTTDLYLRSLIGSPDPGANLLGEEYRKL